MSGSLRFSYVLPAPATSGSWAEFEADLACVRQSGYDAVELQIGDPAGFDEERFRKLSEASGLPLCAFQTGGSYLSRGNCLCSPDAEVRRRTVALLRSFVDLAARWNAVIVFGSLQGRLSDEPDRAAGSARIRESVGEVGGHATKQRVKLAFEPVNHMEVGFHNTIAEVAEVVRAAKLPGLRMMVDTFHMNIEERDMLAPLAGIGDILAHVHLSETNRDVLGAGHWPTAAFLSGLRNIGYRGYCSVGVYNSRLPKAEGIGRCMASIKEARGREG